MTTPVPANWHPDPTGRHDLRYWDGAVWTDHVVSQHVQGIDSLTGPVDGAGPLGPVNMHGDPGEPARTNRKISRQVRKAKVEVDGWQGGGTMQTESVLVINQKPKPFEQRVEYGVFDRAGRRLGEIRETGHNYLLSKFSVYSPALRRRELEVVDRSGAVLYRLIKPAKALKPKVELFHADGTYSGTFSQNRVLSTNLTLEVNGTAAGQIEFSAPHTFRGTIVDAAGETIASIKRTWAGHYAEQHTRADNYVVEVKHPMLMEPLLGLVLTAAVAIDLSFNQREPDKEDAKRQRRSRRWYRA